jgi:Helix-turn-helix domain
MDKGHAMTDKEKAVSPKKETAFKTILATYPGNSAVQQCHRIVEGLRLWKLTTFELSRGLDIYYAPSRIFELRERGYEIKTLWQKVATEAGKLHNVGLYVMIKEPTND